MNVKHEIIAVFQVLAMQSVMRCTSMCVRSCSKNRILVTKIHSQDFKHAYAYNSTATEHCTGCKCSLQNCAYTHYVSASRFSLQKLGKPQYSKLRSSCNFKFSAHAHLGKKQSIGEVLLTFLALYIITQLFWMVIALQDPSRNKIGELWRFEIAIVTNIRMRLKFKVARTPQFAIAVFQALAMLSVMRCTSMRVRSCSTIDF